MVPLLTYLREAGVVPAESRCLTPLGELLGQYRRWMVQERGLAPTTVLRYENTARRFLQEQAIDAARCSQPAGADRGGYQRVPASGVRSGVGRVGEGPGG